MPLQNFVANSLPKISATWLNKLDVFYTTLFNSATTAAAARAALGSTTVGDAVFIAASTSAGRTALGAANSGVNGDITDFQHLQVSAYSPAQLMVNGQISISMAAGAMTVSVLNSLGNDPEGSIPVPVLYRSATATSGATTLLQLSSPCTVVVSSGSTLGTTNATPFRLWIVLFNGVPTVELGVINCLSGSDTAGYSTYPLQGSGMASSTAEGGSGGADSTQVFYTTHAVTSRPYTVIGYAEWSSGQATAGTWATAPSKIQMLVPGTPFPGGVVQQQQTVYAAVATGTTTTPADDTIPQVGEGDQYMSQAITPLSAANLLNVTASSRMANNTGGTMTSALHRDGASNASAVVGNLAGAGSLTGSILNAQLLASSTSASTFSLRIGCSAAGTTTFNGVAGARLYGTLPKSYIAVQEIMT
jgi:hypothetical protein